MESKMIKGTIFDIRRFSTHDGNGIRTTAFLKGCPLSCVWCHNPEGISVNPRVLHFSKRCIKCGICCKLSKYGGAVMKDGTVHIDSSKNEDWDKLIYECPTGALEMDSRSVTVDEAVYEILKDEAFFKHDGGVTLSGGEPLLQPEFAIALLKSLKSKGIHTAIETALYVDTDVVKNILPYLDLIYSDMKIFSSNKHRKYTGVINDTIKTNIRLLLESEKRSQVVIRTPMIPGITTSTENIANISKYISNIYPDVTYELLNYNPLAQAKYSLVDKKFCFKENPKKYSNEQMKQFMTIAKNNGVKNIKIDI